MKSDRDVYSHPPSSIYYLERIKTVAYEDHVGTINIGRRKITNLLFADDINGLAGQEELAKKKKKSNCDATARYHTFYTRTMLPRRKYVPRSSRQSDHTKTSWPSYRDAY